MLGTYLVAFAAMLFAGLSALTLFHAIDSFDPPEVRSAEKDATHPAAA